MLQGHQELVDRTFELAQDQASETYNRFVYEGHKKPETLGALGLYLSIVFAESDELLTADERLRIAKEFVRADDEFDRFSHARAVSLGQLMACRAFRYARRISSHTEVLDIQ